jgi:hypothetical protein
MRAPGIHYPEIYSIAQRYSTLPRDILPRDTLPKDTLPIAQRCVPQEYITQRYTLPRDINYPEIYITQRYTVLPRDTVHCPEIQYIVQIYIA